ncbi:hypothetical protein KIN20_032092 [Parelaphostrongylus tenuis]|uniref:Uncharacterized protein n=1 Tax=Parelaphostrongylus tenuis TaxID=148309 RepID=A0AAD5R6H9_PARTN|nr:hypothetical protein KIN20_032092 [Parelaphostrongylus tenuis]
MSENRLESSLGKRGRLYANRMSNIVNGQGNEYMKHNGDNWLKQWRLKTLDESGET